MDEKQLDEVWHPCTTEASCHAETDNPKLRGKRRDKVTGLWLDSTEDGVTTGPQCPESMPDVRTIHSECENLNSDGMEPETQSVPDITTLGQKAITRGTYQHVLALAGVAKKQQETEFERIERDINSLKKSANSMLATAKRMEDNLKRLRELAVLDM